MSTAGVTPSGQMIVKEPAVKQEMELGTSQMPTLSSAEMSGGEKQPGLSKTLDESEIIDKEPDMPKIVGHLKTDLDIEPVESLEKRERSGSSSSSSSSSDSESDSGQKKGASETSAKVVGSELPTEIPKDRTTTKDFNKEEPVNILPGEKSVDATKPAEKKDDKVEKAELGVSVKDQPLETSIDQPKEVLSSPIQESSAKVLPSGKDSSVRVEPSQPGMTENIEKKVMPPTDNATERHGIKRSYSLSSSSSSSSESDSEREYDAQKHVSVSAPESKIAKIPEESELGYKEVPSGTDIDTTVTPSETKDTVDTKLVTKPPGEKKEKKKDKGRKSGSSTSNSDSEGESDKQKDISDKSPVIDSVKDKTKVTKTPEESEFGSKEVPGGADVGISVTPDQPSETKDIVDSKSVTKPADGDKKKDGRSGSSSSSSSESDAELKSSPSKEPEFLESKDQMNIRVSPIPIIKLTEAEPIEDSSSDEGNVEVPKDKVVKEDVSVTKPSDKDTDKPKDTDTEKPKYTDTPSTYKPDDADKVKKEKQPDIKQKDKVKESKKDGSSSSSSSSSESDSDDKSKEKQKSTDVGKPDKSGSLETDLDKVVSTEPEIIEAREGVQVERQERFEIVEGRAVAKTVITISSKSKDDDGGEKPKIKDVRGPEQEKPFSDSIERKESSSSSSSESEQEVDDVTKQRKDQAETEAKIKEANKMVALETIARAEDKMVPDDKIQDKTDSKKEKMSKDHSSSSSSSSSSESENADDDARRVGEIELMQPVTETMISSDMNEPSYAGPSVTFVQTHRTTIREETSGSGVPDVFQVERSERFETMDNRNITHRKPQKSVSFESSALQSGLGGASRDQSKGHMDTEDDDDGDLEELAMTAQEYLEQDDEEFPDDYKQQYSEHGIKQQSFDYTEDGKNFILCLK